MYPRQFKGIKKDCKEDEYTKLGKFVRWDGWELCKTNTSGRVLETPLSGSGWWMAVMMIYTYVFNYLYIFYFFTKKSSNYKSFPIIRLIFEYYQNKSVLFTVSERNLKSNKRCSIVLH